MTSIGTMYLSVGIVIGAIGAVKVAHSIGKDDLLAKKDPTGILSSGLGSVFVGGCLAGLFWPVVAVKYLMDFGESIRDNEDDDDESLGLIPSQEDYEMEQQLKSL